MATTQTQVGIVAWGDREIYAVDLTTIEPGVGVDVSYSSWGGNATAEIFRVSHEVTVRPTTRDPVEICHIRGDDVPASGTVSVVPDTVALGSLAGATVRLYLECLGSQVGGIS